MVVWVVKGGHIGEFEDTFLTAGLSGKGGILPRHVLRLVARF